MNWTSVQKTPPALNKKVLVSIYDDVYVARRVEYCDKDMANHWRGFVTDDKNEEHFHR